MDKNVICTFSEYEKAMIDLKSDGWTPIGVLFQEKGYEIKAFKEGEENAD